MNGSRPKVKAESEFVYTNKFMRKQIRFAPRADELMATFEPTAEGDVATGVMEAAGMSISEGANLERGFAVFRVPAGQDVAIASASLEAHPAIANTLPVMVDDEGLTRYFLPDEFTVQFREGVSKEEAERIITAQGSRILVEQRTPGYYTLAVPEGKGLFETLRAFSDLPKWPSPSRARLVSTTTCTCPMIPTSPASGACTTPGRPSRAWSGPLTPTLTRPKPGTSLVATPM